MNTYEFQYTAHKHMLTIKKGGLGVTLTLLNNIGPKTAEFLKELVDQANAVIPRPQFIESKIGEYIVYIIPGDGPWLEYYFYRGTSFMGKVRKDLNVLHQTYLPGVDPLPDILKELEEGFHAKETEPV